MCQRTLRKTVEVANDWHGLSWDLHATEFKTQRLARMFQFVECSLHDKKCCRGCHGSGGRTRRSPGQGGVCSWPLRWRCRQMQIYIYQVHQSRECSGKAYVIFRGPMPTPAVHLLITEGNSLFTLLSECPQVIDREQRQRQHLSQQGNKSTQNTATRVDMSYHRVGSFQSLRHAQQSADVRGTSRV